MQLDAATLNQLLDGLETSIFVIDRSGTITYRNHAARASCDADLDRGSDQRGLHARLADAADEVRSTGRARVLMLDTGDDAQWLCKLWPLSPALVGGSARQVTREPATAVAETYGLSIAEARLAVRVAGGLSNQAIASSFAVSIGTIQSRLWRLYRRMQVRNRAELASRIAAIIPAAQRSAS